MKRPTIADLAAAAGVSVATVDRVLNGRLPVREETARKVSEAAERIGFHGANAIRSRLLAEKAEYRLAIILQKERHSFYQDFARTIEATARAVPDRNVRVSIQFAQTADPAELATLLTAAGARAQAIAATGVDHHDVTAAVRALRARGVPTFALLSDFAQGVREAYIGTNNMKVGRTAAWFLTKIARRPGKAVIFIGGHRYHGHALREIGFRTYVREFAPEFEMLDPIINLETRRLTHEALLGVLDKHPDVAVVYCAGGGMEGALTALAEAGRGEAIACLVNELTPDSTQALLERRISGVFQTPLRDVCADVIAAMTHTIDNGMAENPGQRFLAPILWTPESL
jgi:LacI family transcriptional regulator